MITARLFEMQDLGYRDFQCRLMPTVDADTVIGVRTPLLRAYAKELYGTAEAERFTADLPHRYYEENNLHAILIEKQKSYEKCIDMLNAFLPYVNNWATCDMMAPAVFRKHRQQLAEQIKCWIASGDTYTVRFGIKMLMSHFLDSDFDTGCLETVAAVKSDQYYVNMMIAWFFATALAKQYEATLPYITQNRLDPWVHNKTIQKATESYRISDGQKHFLKNQRGKNK